MVSRSRLVGGLLLLAAFTQTQTPSAVQSVGRTESIAARTATVDGLKLQYLSAGRGPAVVLLHGYVPANTTIPAHSHRDDRMATVVSGTWQFGYGVGPTDTRYFDPAHAPKTQANR